MVLARCDLLSVKKDHQIHSKVPWAQRNIVQNSGKYSLCSLTSAQENILRPKLVQCKDIRWHCTNGEKITYALLESAGVKAASVLGSRTDAKIISSELMFLSYYPDF